MDEFLDYDLKVYPLDFKDKDAIELNLEATHYIMDQLAAVMARFIYTVERHNGKVGLPPDALQQALHTLFTGQLTGVFDPASNVLLRYRLPKTFELSIKASKRFDVDRQTIRVPIDKDFPNRAWTFEIRSDRRYNYKTPVVDYWEPA